MPGITSSLVLLTRPGRPAPGFSCNNNTDFDILKTTFLGACRTYDNLLRKSQIGQIFRFFSTNSDAISLKKPKKFASICHFSRYDSLSPTGSWRYQYCFLLQ